MARKIVAVDDVEKFGIMVSYPDKTSGFVVGQGGEIVLFNTRRQAEKALKAMKADDNYTWNCAVEVAPFRK